MPNTVRSAAVIALTLSLMTGCDSSRSATEPAYSESQAPVEVSLYEQFDDINFCGGQIVTYTFEGTARVQQQGDRYLLVAQGTVTTSDGFTGTFNRQFIIKGDQVVHLRFHDIELNSATGERQIFALGMYHYTTVDGQTVVGFEKYGGTLCVPA
jgi:hypothetical protein